MATRDLRFNIFANDRASAAFARASAAADAFASRITALNGRRARIRIEADTSEVEAKLARAQAELEKLERRKASPTIDADIALFEARIVKAEKDLAKLSRAEATPEVDVAIAKAESDILHFRERIEDLNRQKASPEVDARIEQAQAKVEELQAQLSYLQRNGTVVDVDADPTPLQRKLAEAQERLEELDRYRPSVDIDADVADANRQIEQLQDRLRQLDAERVDVDIDARTAEATADIERLERQLESLGRQTQTPLIRLHTAQVQADIQRLRSELTDLERQRQIRIDIEDTQAEIAALRVQLSELDNMRITPEIQIQIDQAVARLAFLRAQMEAFGDRNVAIRLREVFDRGAGSLLGYLNDTRRMFQANIQGAAQLMRNVRQLFVPISTAGLLPTLSALGAAFRDMAGAISLLPAAAGFAATAIATLAVGFSGLTDAIGPRDTGTQIKKAELAMSRLGEEAQQLARVVIDLKDEWNGLKQAVQNALFEDLAEVFQSLAAQYIPLLQRGLVGMAEEFNLLALDMNAFFRSARTTEDVNRLFTAFQLTVNAIRPGIMNIVEAFFDLSVVGSTFLPALAERFTGMTERFKDFIETARNDGSLQLWIANGILAIQQFGQVLGNIGGIFGAFFDAAKRSGESFLTTMVRITGEMEAFLKSADGQTALVSLFKGIREAIDAMMPGLRSFLSSLGEAIQNFQPAFGALGAAFTALSQALSPAMAMMASLASDILVPLAAAFVGVANVIGPIVPMVITLAVAFKGFTVIAGIVAGAGAALAAFSTHIGLATLATMNFIGKAPGLAAAGAAAGAAANNAAAGATALGSGVQRAAAAIPLLGAAVIGLMVAYDYFSADFDKAAQNVVTGTQSMTDAVAEQAEVLDRNHIEWLGGLSTAETYAEAQRQVTQRIREQLDVMNPLQRAQAEVNIAENNYLEILGRLGPEHEETIAALSILQGARERQTRATEDHTRATQTDTEALIENTNRVAEAANADLALERATMRTTEAKRAATEAINEHGASSEEATRATMDLRQSVLDEAAAAQRQAEATAEATGRTDAAEVGARAYADRLIALAGTMDGPTRDALVGTIANLDTTRRGENDAAIAAAGLTDAIRAVPTQQSTTVTTPGLPQALVGLQNLTVAVSNLKDKSFKIRADGEVVGVGMTGLATGGIMPGYTPGRDVHLAALSGGEAVMRPEWTRAVGADYVYAANAVARAGGIGAVRTWMQNGGATGGEKGIGPQHVHEYAVGGVVNRGITGNVEYSWPPPTVTDWANNVTRKFTANVSAAAKRAMASMGGGSGPGGVGWMMAALRQRFPGLALISGFRPGAITATGNRSYHAQGRAVDVPPRMDVFNWIKATYGRNTKELIYSPAGAGQVWNGRDHMYTGITRANHWDHVHWAFDKGGEADGKGLMFKSVLRPERVLDPEMTQTFNRLVDTLRTGGFSNGTVPSTPILLPQRSPSMNLSPLLRELATLRAELISRPQQVINQNIDGGQNPVETGRSSAMAIRLARRG